MLPGELHRTIAAPAIPGTAVSSPFFGRLLAAFIDYLTVSALVIFFSRWVKNPDWQAAPAFSAALVYFTIGNSVLTGGQTLGKKVFGLQVISKQQRGPLFLPLWRAALRYIASFGVYVLGAEVPYAYYRAHSITGSPLVLEFHMLILLVYACTNFSYLLFEPQRRGLHDLLSGSRVVRAQKLLGTISDGELPVCIKAAPLKMVRRNSFFAHLAGTTTGGLLWALSVFHANAVVDVQGQRFKLEHDFSLRITSIALVEKHLQIECVLLPGKPRDESGIAKEIGQKLLDEHLVGAADVSEIDFLFLQNTGASTQSSNTARQSDTARTEVSFTTSDMSVARHMPSS